MQRLVLPIGIWIVATALATLTGPFGTHDAMSFAPRLVYWSVVSAVSVGLSYVAQHLEQGKTLLQRLLVWGGFATVLTTGIFAANSVLFDGWASLTEYAFLLRNVAVIIVLVFTTIGLISLSRSKDEAADQKTGGLQQFLARLPMEKRGALIRLEAQDHYLKVVTQRGDCLILMRIGDAAQELGEAQGCMVHRSHWVANGAVERHQRAAGRDVLVTRDGAEVPVSRGRKTQIAQAIHLMRE